MDLTSNFFEVFSLPTSYDVDQPLLAERYRLLQQQFHPDKFSRQSAQQQRIAEQFAALINQGFTTLKSPLLRAQYLLDLQGVDASHENSTHQDMAFLMEQMQLREQLSDVPGTPDPYTELGTLSRTVGGRFQQLQESYASAYNSGDLHSAAEIVAKMQFFNKLQVQIQDLELELDQ